MTRNVRCAGLRVLEGIERLNAEQALDLAARAAVTTGEAIVSASTRTSRATTRSRREARSR
jgi:hypothetical protein